MLPGASGSSLLHIFMISGAYGGTHASFSDDFGPFRQSFLQSSAGECTAIWDRSRSVFASCSSPLPRNMLHPPHHRDLQPRHGGGLCALAPVDIISP